MAATTLPHLTSPIPEILSYVESELRKIYGERFKGLYLYGSYARGDFRPGRSDLDLAFVLDQFESHFEEIDRTGDMRVTISLDHGLTLSLLPISEAELASDLRRLSRILQREGVRIA
jgi:predicted nucleotidyltransferase